MIGTGASAVQFVPLIQSHVKHLSLFLRTPLWILPRLDRPIPAWQRTLFRLLPITQRLARMRIYLRQELIAIGLVYRPNALEDTMKVARKHLARQVPDPVLKAKLTPQYMMGCKRILLSNDFYPALTQSNIDVLSEHICEVRAHSMGVM